ncbi:MAG: L-histidine N(alpha)-methyltransferase [Candidatus Woesearchaeota archaeon]
MKIINATQNNFIVQIADIVLRQLNGDYSDSLTRFSYISGAEDFIKFTCAENYFGYSRELILIDKMLPNLINKIQNYSQIIDLGPGDGCKAVRIINGINGKISRYLGLDISLPLLNSAQKSQTIIRDIDRHYAVCDFNNIRNILELSINDMCQDRLFLLLGNTLTNEINMSHFLENLREMVNLTNENNNFLLLGIEILSDDVTNIIREYTNEDNYVLTFRPLEFLGVNRQDGVINISFNKTLRRIEEEFIFTKNSRVTSNLYDIEFNVGDRILLSVTYKPDITEITNLIKRSGWNIYSVELEDSQVMMLLSSR